MLFDKKISILVPYKSDNSHREQNWLWIKKRYKKIMPNSEICLGSYNKTPFSRAIAINNAAKIATRNIFLIADADILFDLNQIAEAILALSYFPWIVPYTKINYLNLSDTKKLLKLNSNISIKNIDLQNYSTLNCTNAYGNVNIYGGITIVPRKFFEKVGGFDKKFKGWGAEDNAFQRTLDTICGQHGRIDTTLWHMYHTPAPKDNSLKNCKLLDKFYSDKISIINSFNKKEGL